MEFKELLIRLSVPVTKATVNEEELIKQEEANFSETLINVKFLLFKFTQKNTNFIAPGFELKEEDENEGIGFFNLVEYTDYSIDDYIEDIQT
jgi:hypothetical protein